MSMPEPDDSRWTVSGPSAWPSAAGSTGWFSPVPTHESTCVAEPAVPELAQEGVEAALLLDGLLKAGEGRHRVRAAGAVPADARVSFVRSSMVVPPTCAARPERHRTPLPVARSGLLEGHDHVRRRFSRLRPVRSRWIGVTAIRRLTTAWKSVPSTASPDGGGPPIQK